jgi:hypothetical protein
MAHDRVDISPARFWRDGYAVIRSVFGADEIARFRERALASNAAHKGDLLANPSLRDVLLDDRLLAIARSLLGARPVYSGDSSCVIGGRSHGWHKDNADPEDPRAPDWQGRYTPIRFGLYLQDHARTPGGSTSAPSHTWRPPPVPARRSICGSGSEISSSGTATPLTAATACS